jgi:hypothetical protein
MRFLYYLSLAFVLYLIAKGVYRRFLAPPPGGRPEMVRQSPPRREIDYSKIKDATYREVESRRVEGRGSADER